MRGRIQKQKEYDRATEITDPYGYIKETIKTFRAIVDEGGRIPLLSKAKGP